MTLQGFIRSAANKKAVPHKTLAKRLGVSPITFSRWLAGRNTPELGRLPALARVLGVPLKRLQKVYLANTPPAVDRRCYTGYGLEVEK